MPALTQILLASGGMYRLPLTLCCSGAREGVGAARQSAALAQGHAG